MKKLFFLLTFILITQFTIAQEKQGIVNYGYIKSLLFGNKNEDEFNAQLLFDSNQSYFVTQKDSLEKEIVNSTEVKIISSTNNEDNSKSATVIGNRAYLTTLTGNQVYYNKNKDSIWSFLRNPNNMYIAEKRPTISWKFEKETKKIGTYTCYKAIAPFRGREYTVWYTPEIPIPYGPWKFNGLPGLVLEAYDSEYKIYFYFKNIEYPVKEPIKIDFIKEAPDSTFKKWFTYKMYLKTIKIDNKIKYEKMLLLAKQIEDFIPVEPKIEQHYIEISD